jgi:hypothetical protein
MVRIRSIGRTTIAFAVGLTLAAWFSLSNHCPLGAVAPVSEAASGSCPMHSGPTKKKPANKTPCCKDVRALVAKGVSASVVGGRLMVPRDCTTAIFARQPVRIAIQFENLDTGPPGCFSFAESVLQESMLSHAPPVS